MLTISRVDLVAVLQAMKDTVTKTPENPLCLVVIEDGRAYATNYDEWRFRDVETQGAGLVLLPVHETLKGVKALRGDVVELDTEVIETSRETTQWDAAMKVQTSITVVDKSARTTIRCGTFKLELKNLPVFDVDLPTPWDVEARLFFTVETLGAILHRTCYCMSLDETRPSLNGAFLRLEADALTIVATDGSRLAVTRQLVEGPETPHDMIVGMKGIWEIERMVKANKKAVAWLALESKTVTPDKTTANPDPKPWKTYRLRVTIGPDEVLTRGLDELYPPYQKVIPKHCPVRVDCTVSDLEAGMDAMRPWLDPKTRIVRFTVLPSALQLNVSNPNGREVTDEVVAVVSGLPEPRPEVPVLHADGSTTIEEVQPLRVGFNEAYFKDVTDRLTEKSLTLQLADQFSPAKIQEGNTTHIVMPMRV